MGEHFNEGSPEKQRKNETERRGAGVCVCVSVCLSQETDRWWKLGKSKICRVGGQSGDPGEPMVEMKSKGILLENSLLLPFLFYVGLIGWGPPTSYRAIGFTQNSPF